MNPSESSSHSPWRFTVAISKDRTPFRRNGWLIAFLLIFLGVWADSLIGTTDMSNWRLENMLTALFFVFLIVTYRKHQFSDLSYLLMCLFFCLHAYGSKYTYSENPFGYWLMESLELSRNHYDRIVHFSFGFLLAYPLREMFLKWLKYPNWVAWMLPIEITLSVSAFYELIEWVVADIVFKSHGTAFLGTQGDVWDAQKDIFLAFCGAIIATTIVSALKKAFRVYEDGV